MHKFTDKLGREWSVEITVAEVERLSDEEGIDIGKQSDVEKIFASTKSFLKTLWMLIGDQVRERNLTDLDVKKSFGPQALSDAVEAVRNEIVFFSPNPEPIKALVKAGDTRRAKLVEQRMERVKREIEDGKHDADLMRASSPTATASPESSESIPDA